MGFDPHAAELPQLEMTAIFSYSCMAEEDGAAGVQLDQSGSHRKKWSQGKQQDTGTENVDATAQDIPYGCSWPRPQV
jgi:hypothetical protein